jgi:hypothetical protein
MFDPVRLALNPASRYLVDRVHQIIQPFAVAG